MATLETAYAAVMINSLVSLLDAGKLQFWTAVGGTGTKLAECTFGSVGTTGSPAFTVATTGVATATTITDEDAALDTGTAAYCMLTLSNGTTNVLDLTVASSGSPDITISNTSIATSDIVSVTSLILTLPEGP